MVLNDCQLNNLINSDKPLVYPIDVKDGIQPASVDIRLGDNFLKPIKTQGKEYNTFGTEVEYDKISGEVLLYPHEFMLGTTVEYIKLPNDLTAFVEGRSSIGRMGLFIQNAGWVDPGFEGQITLELYNASEVPILLKPFTRVAQLVFCTLDFSCKHPYRGKYQGQIKATGSKIHLDKKENK